MFGRERTTSQMMDSRRERLTRSPNETRELGKRIGAQLQGGDVVLLHGNLGAGKTVFAAGLAAGLGAENFRGSPTFALVNEYETWPRLFHVDLYRLSESEAEDLGLEEYVREDSILVCEWSERAEPYLRSLASHDVIDVEIELANDESRYVTVGWTTPAPAP